MGFNASKTLHKIFNTDSITLFDKVTNALIGLGYSISSKDPGSLTIFCSSPMSLLSWGEDLTVAVVPGTNHDSKMIITSKCKFGIVDWGKNEKNIQAIFKMTESLLGEQTSQQ